MDLSFLSAEHLLLRSLCSFPLNHRDFESQIEPKEPGHARPLTYEIPWPCMVLQSSTLPRFGFNVRSVAWPNHANACTSSDITSEYIRNLSPNCAFFQIPFLHTADLTQPRNRHVISLAQMLTGPRVTYAIPAMMCSR